LFTFARPASEVFISFVFVFFFFFFDMMMRMQKPLKTSVCVF
jgi:hypothetical protein